MSYIIKEIFLTLQGEGTRAGTKAVFVRFAGCNLWNGHESGRSIGKGSCARWCDTEFVGGEVFTAVKVIESMDLLWPVSDPAQPRWCVLTGGEPLLQVDRDLIAAFDVAGWSVAVETNGTIPLPCEFDWVTVSPKRSPLPIVVTPDELKIVLGVEGTWTDQEVHMMGAALDCPDPYLFVQPLDTGEQADLCRAMDFVMRHPQWRLSIQMHKVLGIP